MYGLGWEYDTLSTDLFPICTYSEANGAVTKCHDILALTGGMHVKNIKLALCLIVTIWLMFIFSVTDQLWWNFPTLSILAWPKPIMSYGGRSYVLLAMGGWYNKKSAPRHCWWMPAALWSPHLLDIYSQNLLNAFTLNSIGRDGWHHLGDCKEGLPSIFCVRISRSGYGNKRYGIIALPINSAANLPLSIALSL